MATCKKCGKSVGCGCNLMSGKCHVCFAEDGFKEGDAPVQKKVTKRIKFTNPSPVPPNNAFTDVLQQKGLSKEEKIKRINDIIENGKKNVDNQL